MEYTYKYPRPAVTADCVVITREAEPQVLLIQRGNQPFKGCWAFPGGFMNMDETTEDRLTFLIHIPIHAGCGNKPATEKTTVITTEKSAIGSEKIGSGSEKSSEKNQAIISAIKLNPKVTAAEIAMKLGVSSRAVEKRIKTLRENGVIRRIGGDKGGYWELIENGTEQ